MVFSSDKYIKKQLDWNILFKSFFLVCLYVFLSLCLLMPDFYHLQAFSLECDFPRLWWEDSGIWIWNWCQHFNSKPEYSWPDLASFGICRPFLHNWGDYNSISIFNCIIIIFPAYLIRLYFHHDNILLDVYFHVFNYLIVPVYITGNLL